MQLSFFEALQLADVDARGLADWANAKLASVGHDLCVFGTQAHVSTLENDHVRRVRLADNAERGLH
jgi:hypothetical protein